MCTELGLLPDGCPDPAVWGKEAETDPLELAQQIIAGPKPPRTRPSSGSAKRSDCCPTAGPTPPSGVRKPSPARRAFSTTCSPDAGTRRPRQNGCCTPNQTWNGVAALIVLPTSSRTVARSMKLKKARSSRRPAPSACATPPTLRPSAYTAPTS